MRYIITYLVSKGDEAAVTATRAVIADSEENAREAFRAKRENKIVRIQLADESMRMRCGLGWYTDEEESEIKRNLQARYDNIDIKKRKALEDVSTMEPDEFAAHAAYVEARSANPTQNAAGIHVGDILEHSYGYDMISWCFYQVIELRGARTIVVRENATKSAAYDHGNGFERPIRDSFKDDSTHIIRTSLKEWPDGSKYLRIKTPWSDKNMEPINGIGIHEYDHND